MINRLFITLLLMSCLINRDKIRKYNISSRGHWWEFILRKSRVRSERARRTENAHAAATWRCPASSRLGSVSTYNTRLIPPGADSPGGGGGVKYKHLYTNESKQRRNCKSIRRYVMRNRCLREEHTVRERHELGRSRSNQRLKLERYLLIVKQAVNAAGARDASITRL